MKTGFIYNVTEKGFIGPFSNATSVESWLKGFNNNIYKINSIKRLSDGEVFTIGDSVRYINNNEYIIQDIWKDHLGKILIKARNKVCEQLSCINILENIFKYKQSLFKTEDGVDIFEGDLYYFIRDDGNFKLDRMSNPQFKGTFDLKSNKFFVSKEKAEEYVIMNMPCLSINEICPLIGKANHTSYIDLNSLSLALNNLVKQKVGL